MKITVYPAETKIVEVAPAVIDIILTKEEAGQLASILGKVIHHKQDGLKLFKPLVDFVGGSEVYSLQYCNLYNGSVEHV